MKYALDLAWCVPTPGGVSYGLWWPWLKNYYGASNSLFFQYFWVDETLKHSMGR